MREIKFRGWYKGAFVYATAFENVMYEYPQDMPIQQYTGLKDKAGIEIYEGDIVEVTADWDGEKSTHTIEYGISHNYPAFDLKPALDTDSNGLSHIFNTDDEIEVIGNIYMTPELVSV